MTSRSLVEFRAVERVRCVARTEIPTRWGRFRTLGFVRETAGAGVDARVETALALYLGDLSGRAPLLRVHSQCITGEVFGSQRCDCCDQLNLAFHSVACEGRGLLIYEHQEGRGIGLMAKLQAYALQDGGLDTVEANHALGFESDHRDFALPVAILRVLGVSRVRLLSNNPAKVRALMTGVIEVLEQRPCETPPTPHSIAYLRTKRDKLGHTLRALPPDSVDRHELV